MNPWRSLPLLRLVFPFIAGIICADNIAGSLKGLPGLVFLVIAVAVLASMQRTFMPFRLRWMPGLVILSATFLSGVLISGSHSGKAVTNIPVFDRKKTFLVRPEEAPTSGKNSCRFVAGAYVIHPNGGLVRSLPKIIVRIYKGRRSIEPVFGNYYLVYGRPETLEFLGSGNSFNYNRYLHNKGVRYELNCRSEEVRELPWIKSGSLAGLALSARDELLGILKGAGVSGQEFAVASGLLLGYTSEIDSGLKSAFAATGTMHVLSVSGMHVGIIFLFLEIVLSFLMKIRYGNYVKALVQILFIWVYAAVTGFSPAVLRASVCLSLICAGRTMKRKPDMMNLLSASLIILLAADPGILYDLGFQLSYLSVTGILLLYKPIYDLYVTHRWLPDKLWSLIAVSVAAQIATCPLSLYYFHRFPNYFMLTNLAIVPLSNGIILMGILTLVCAGLPLIGALCARALSILLFCMNKCILWFACLPGAVSAGFYPSAVTVILSYLILLFLFLYITLKHRKSFIMALSCMLLMAMSSAYSSMLACSRKSVSIHASGRGFVLRYVRDCRELCLFSGLRMTEDRMVKAQLFGEREANRVDRIQERYISFKGWQGRAGFPDAGRFGPLICVGGKIVCLLDKPPPRTLVSALHADILLVTGKVYPDLDRLVKLYSPDVVLNAAMVTHSRSLLWKEKASALGLKYYDLKQAGFYLEEF